MSREISTNIWKDKAYRDIDHTLLKQIIARKITSNSPGTTEFTTWPSQKCVFKICYCAYADQPPNMASVMTNCCDTLQAPYGHPRFSRSWVCSVCDKTKYLLSSIRHEFHLTDAHKNTLELWVWVFFFHFRTNYYSTKKIKESSRD